MMRVVCVMALMMVQVRCAPPCACADETLLLFVPKLCVMFFAAVVSVILHPCLRICACVHACMHTYLHPCTDVDTHTRHCPPQPLTRVCVCVMCMCNCACVGVCGCMCVWVGGWVGGWVCTDHRGLLHHHPPFSPPRLCFYSYHMLHARKV